MNALDSVRLGDLQALILIGRGLSIEGAAMILETKAPCIRYRLKCLERAMGVPVYHRKSKKDGYVSASLTDEGYALAAYGCEVLSLMEDVTKSMP